MRSVKKGLMAAGVGMAINIMLAIIKIVAGVLGNSYALIADGIESTTDIVSSLVVWTGLKVSSLPPDDELSDTFQGPIREFRVNPGDPNISWVKHPKELDRIALESPGGFSSE